MLNSNRYLGGRLDAALMCCRLYAAGWTWTQSVKMAGHQARRAWGDGGKPRRRHVGTGGFPSQTSKIPKGVMFINLNAAAAGCGGLPEGGWIR